MKNVKNICMHYKNQNFYRIIKLHQKYFVIFKNSKSIPFFLVLTWIFFPIIILNKKNYIKVILNLIFDYVTNDYT